MGVPHVRRCTQASRARERLRAFRAHARSRAPPRAHIGHPLFVPTTKFVPITDRRALSLHLPGRGVPTRGAATALLGAPNAGAHSVTIAPAACARAPRHAAAGPAQRSIRIQRPLRAARGGERHGRCRGRHKRERRQRRRRGQRGGQRVFGSRGEQRKGAAPAQLWRLRTRRGKTLPCAVLRWRRARRRPASTARCEQASWARRRRGATPPTCGPPPRWLRSPLARSGRRDSRGLWRTQAPPPAVLPATLSRRERIRTRTHRRRT